MVMSDNLAIAGVYRIRNTVNGKVYVGSAVNLRRRLLRHENLLRKSRHENLHLQSAFNRYGAECFSFEPVVTLKEMLRSDKPNMKAELLFWEQFFIDHYRSADKCFGYNKAPTAGSCLGVELSEESCQRISIAQKAAQNRPEVLEATRRRSVELKLHRNFGDVSGEHNGMYGVHRIGSSSPFYGKNHTAETREAIRKIRTGTRLSEETRRRISAAGKIAQNRPEILKANKERHRGSCNGMYSKSAKDFMTPEAFEQMRSRMRVSGKQAWADPERHRELSEILRRRHFRNYLVSVTTQVQDWT